MGVTFLVVSVGLAVAGYLGYCKLQRIEDDIRNELKEEPDTKAKGGAVQEEKEAVIGETLQERTKPSSVTAAGEGDLESMILEKIRQRPGVLQTELYSDFPGRERKELQALLLKMDREKRIVRKKKGSTYQLFTP